MACSKRYKKIVKGFTVVEIIIVIVIIVILGAITVPVFRVLEPSFQLSGAVRDLVTNIHYAQQLTVTEQVNYCVKLFLSEKKYQIIQCGEADPFSEIFLPNEISTFDATGFANNEVEFNPYGAVKESGTISLENTQNQTKTIEVRPSGFVKIVD